MTKRRALGKGLSALIPEGNSLSRGDETFFQCPIEEIEPNPYQPRQVFDGPELEAMNPYTASRYQDRSRVSTHRGGAPLACGPKGGP
jgi:hypothetical protein